MPLPPLHTVSNQIYTNGNVTIQEGAVIAPGVILRADADSRILIAAGACIGMGAILHAHQGTIEVQAGAILGSGVLVVGKGTIGTNACVGATTTIYNSNINSEQVVAAGSLCGEMGRKVEQVSSKSVGSDQPVEQEKLNEAPSNNDHTQVEQIQPESAELEENNSAIASSTPEINSTSSSSETNSDTSNTENTEDKPSIENVDKSNQAIEKVSNNNFGLPIYGQDNLQRLLGTLFPYKKSLNSSDSQSDT